MNNCSWFVQSLIILTQTCPRNGPLLRKVSKCNEAGGRLGEKEQRLLGIVKQQRLTCTSMYISVENNVCINNLLHDGDCLHLVEIPVESRHKIKNC